MKTLTSPLPLIGRQPIVAHISKELEEVRKQFKSDSLVLKCKLDSILELQREKNDLMSQRLKFEMLKAGITDGKYFSHCFTCTFVYTRSINLF